MVQAPPTSWKHRLWCDSGAWWHFDQALLVVTKVKNSAFQCPGWPIAMINLCRNSFISQREIALSLLSDAGFGDTMEMDKAAFLYIRRLKNGSKIGPLSRPLCL